MNDSTITSPIKAIKAHCADCCCGSAHEVKLCPVKDCALYPFRLGKNPYRTKREYTEEQRAAMVERLAKNRPQK